MVGMSRSRRDEHKAPPAKPATDDASGPRRWWQWLLLYPTLAIALLTAAPEWLDKARALHAGTRAASYSEAERQGAIWRKNLACSAVPFAWYANPSNVRVDATICNSGDVYVRASTPDNQQYFKWIGLDDILKVPAAGGGLIPAADAAPMSPAIFTLAGERPRPTDVQFTNAVVVCQRVLDQRNILRHVRTEQGCFDETIDTFNGTIVKRVQVPCRTQC